MSSASEGTSSGSRRRYCGLGDHFLNPPYKTIQDEKMRNFAKKLNPELRSTTLICGVCYETLRQIFRVKLRNAVEHKKRKIALGNTNSVSDISSSQQPSSQSSSRNLPAYAASSIVSSTSTTTSSEDSTSSSAKRRRVDPDSAQAPHSTNNDDADDDEPLLSLNAVNGTRLPNVQPIPRRRQFVTLNKTAMDIYLAGTTGG